MQKCTHGDKTLQIIPLLLLCIALDKSYFGAFHIAANFV